MTHPLHHIFRFCLPLNQILLRNHLEVLATSNDQILGNTDTLQMHIVIADRTLNLIIIQQRLLAYVAPNPLD